MEASVLRHPLRRAGTRALQESASTNRWRAAVAGSCAITALNVFGIRFAGGFQTLATLFIFLGGIGLLVAALSNGKIANLQPLLAEGGAGVAAVTVMAPFLLFGFDVIPQAAEEIDLPQRLLGKLIFLCVVMATL